MYFEAFGPFWPGRVAHDRGRYWRAELWKEIERTCAGLSTANGIYIFSLCLRDRFVPWYVGKTCSTKGFAGEVFQGHKIDHYYRAEADRKGMPALHLVARLEPNQGNFSGYSDRSRHQIEELETMMIGMALTVNADLQNDKKTAFRRALSIPGLMGDKGPGPRTHAARTLRQVFGMDGV